MAEKVEVSLSMAEVGANIATHRQINGTKLDTGIAIKISRQGKVWNITRTREEFNNLQHTLEKEFSGVLQVPALPALPASDSDSLEPLKGYLASLINHPSIKTSDFLRKFVDFQEEIKVMKNSTKKGPLSLKSGKTNKYEVTVENRLLYCIGQKSGVCELAVLLDNCEISIDDECAFIINTRSTRDRTQGKRKTVLGKLSQNASSPASYYFIAYTSAERDEWVEVIKVASQLFKEASYTVSGRLSVEVVEGRALAPKDFHLIRAASSDPYVVLRIEQQQMKSRTINRNLNPVWNEEFSFFISQNQGILFILIYDEDLLSRSDSMGQVAVALSGLAPGVLHDMWLPVLPRKPQEKVSGEIRLRIKYEYSKEEKPAVLGPIFSTNLQEICDNPRLCENGVPTFFAKFLSYLEANAVSEEGIFRVSGSFSQVKEIKQKIDEGRDIDLRIYDIHSISGALKLFLRELPVPLLTYENYNKLIEITSISSDKEMLHQLKMIMVVIPSAHIDLLKLLLPSLKKFSENSKVNMMTTTNLAIVFGPSLIRPQVDNFETVLHTVNITTLMSLLIEHNIGLFQ